MRIEKKKLGAVGGIAAFANACPQETADLYKAIAIEKDLEKAQRIQLKYCEANFAVTGKFGVPGLKQVMQWLKYGDGGEDVLKVREPLLPLTETQRGELRKIFERSLG